MDTKELIDSGDLELYVFGVLDDKDNLKITTIANNDSIIKDEIITIEKSIIALSSSFSPNLSSELFQKAKNKIKFRHRKVVKMKSKSTYFKYINWAASFVMLFGIGYLFFKHVENKSEIATIEKQKLELNEAIVKAENENKNSKVIIDVIRDKSNTVVNLGGQAIAPEAFAKIYWNKKTEVVYVDASGLPEPPEGKVYQIWSLKLLPILTPTSIGVLNNFNDNNLKIFAVSNTGDAEAFGITLEPTGGSKSPTMEKLYTLGKV